MPHNEGTEHMKANGAAVAETPPLNEDAANVEIDRLSKLNDLAYARQRSRAANDIGIPPGQLDRLVKARRPSLDDELVEETAGQGRPLELLPRDPWEGSVDGAELLEELTAAMRRYVVLEPGDVALVALWVVASYSASEFFIFPRLFITSPEKRCGKSTLLDVIEAVVNKPLVASNIKSAALFRSIELTAPTMLLDEADTFLRGDDDLRGIVNSGHKRNGAVVRCVGDDHEARQFSTFCPMVIAGIGAQHETIEDRCITVALRRKRSDEAVESFRPDRAEHLTRLARKIARFARDNQIALAGADPEMPGGVFNRLADNFRPLLAVADLSGGKWPEQARKLATAASMGGEEAASSRLLVLSDIRDIYAESGEEWMGSSALVDKLVAIEGRPWAEWKGSKNGLTTHGLARLLKPHGITPNNKKVIGKVLKGYHRSQFDDTFARYLTNTPNQTATSLPLAQNLGFEGNSQPLPDFGGSGLRIPGNPQKTAKGSGVAFANAPHDDLGGEDGHVGWDDAV
jgi:putative DNA primase/helicase